MTIVPGTSTRRAIDTLREQLAPEANNDELEWLAAVGQRLGLDPIAGHLVLIPRWDNRLKRAVHRPQITADGRLVLAERTGELDGFDGPEWTGPRDAQGNHRWVDLWDEEDPPHAARCIVYRRGRTHPANGTVRWHEFAQYNSNNVLLPTWTKMPSHMLGKVALSLGLRRAFGDVIPADADVDDDFAPFEREAVDTATGEILDATPPPPEPPADSQLSEPPAPGERAGPVAPPGVNATDLDKLQTILWGLSERDRMAFRDWRRSAGIEWPPTSNEALRKMRSEADTLEQRANEERDTYEPPVGSPLD